MNAQVKAGISNMKAVARPSLYSGDMPVVRAGKAVSILASLEADRSVAFVNRKTWVMALAVMLLATAYWVFAHAKEESSPWLSKWAAGIMSVPKVTPPSTSAIAQEVTPKPALPLAAMADNSRAEVITADATPANVAPSYTQSPVKDDLNKAEREVTSKRAIDAPPEKMIVAAEPKMSKADEKSVATKKTVNKQESTGAIAKAAPKSAAPVSVSSAPVKAKKSEKDADVDLIAALLSRVANPSTAGKTAANNEVQTPVKEAVVKDVPVKEASIKEVPPPAKAHVDKSADKQVVAAREPVVTTEMKLKQCQAKGFLEAEWCRFRTCSNRWGKDPACPAPSQTTAQGVN